MSPKRPIYLSPFNERVIFKNQKEENGFFYLNAAGILYPDKNYKAIHYSNHYSFQHIISGEGYVEYKGERRVVKTGDMFYIGAKKGITYGVNAARPYTKMWFNGFGKYFEMIEDLYNLGGHFDIISLGDNTIVAEIFHKIFNHLKSGEPDDEELMCLILRLVSRASSFRGKHNEAADTSSTGNITSNNVAYEIKRYIDIHMYDSIHLSDIALIFGISERTLYSIFRNEFGISPHFYIQNEKLAIAARMLIATDNPLSSIAKKLCFCSPSYFSKKFKNKYGIPPGQYRQQKGI